ncbi:MAG: hypothetical protein ACTSSE_19535 [Candidatus Thorarchaeota archaeon]
MTAVESYDPITYLFWIWNVRLIDITIESSFSIVEALVTIIGTFSNLRTTVPYV